MSGGSDDGVGDVEDHISANEGEGSLPWDTFNHVLELVKSGNREFRQSNYSQAIGYYTRANNIKRSDSVILGNRCASYIRICKSLIHRSASASERTPLNGLDATTHAELALKDAEKLINMQSNSVKSYILKASALILLEKYEMARDVILSGLQLDPFSNFLKNSLQNMEKAKEIVSGRRNQGRPERTDDFDCTLCLKLLYDPVTTPCGHSFCRSCLFQAIDRSNKCPLCRTVLFISPKTYAISVTLNNIIQKNFPEEYAERKSEIKDLTDFGVDVIPLFVMEVVIPCQKFPLHIFEPRYRLMASYLFIYGYVASTAPGHVNMFNSSPYFLFFHMYIWVIRVRRIMQGNHRMGMIIDDPTTGSVVDVACEVEITEYEPLPDGRFYLEVESRRRFRIIRTWEQDGYRVAEVEWLQDIYPPEGTTERDDLQELTNNAAEYTRSWLMKARQSAQCDPRKVEKIHYLESMMPTTRDPERFSFWLATLTSLRPHEKLELLRMRDTKERIKRGLIYLKSDQGCRMQ